MDLQPIQIIHLTMSREEVATLQQILLNVRKGKRKIKITNLEKYSHQVAILQYVLIQLTNAPIVEKHNLKSEVDYFKSTESANEQTGTEPVDLVNLDLNDLLRRRATLHRAISRLNKREFIPEQKLQNLSNELADVTHLIRAKRGYACPYRRPGKIEQE